LLQQAGAGQARNDHCLEAAGGLKHDEIGPQYLAAADEVVESGSGTRNDETLTTWTHGNIMSQPIEMERHGIARDPECGGGLARLHAFQRCVNAQAIGVEPLS